MLYSGRKEDFQSKHAQKDLSKTIDMSQDKMSINAVVKGETKKGEKKKKKEAESVSQPLRN